MKAEFGLQYNNLRANQTNHHALLLSLRKEVR